MPQPQPNTGFGSQKLDVGALLQSILGKVSSTGEIDPSKIPGNAQAVPTINPTTNLHDDQASALQGVLDKHDKAQAEEAFNMQGPDAMRQLLDYHYQTAPSNKDTNNSSPNNSSTTQQTKQVDPIQKQAINIVSPATTVLGKLFEAAGFGTDTKQKQLNNLRIAQELTGGQPLQQKEVQQAALDTQTKINQALTVPPTQAEKLQNAAAYAGYKTTALNDMLANNNTAMTQQNETLKNMQGYSSWVNKPFGTMPKEAQQAVKKLKQLQLERLGISAELNKHQNLLASGGASTSPFQEGQTYTDANGNTATFKNGKFQ